MAFQPGDMVRCTNNKGCASHVLVTGRVYTVCSNYDGILSLAEVRGYDPVVCDGWYAYRFELVPDDDSVFTQPDTCEFTCVMQRIKNERTRQDAKFGPQGNLANIPAFQRLSVLTEEVGEVAMALNDGDLAHAREELVQVAAVAVAWLEVLEERGVAV